MSSNLTAGVKDMTYQKMVSEEKSDIWDNFACEKFAEIRELYMLSLLSNFKFQILSSVLSAT